MTTLHALKREALASAEFRGHRLGRWIHHTKPPVTFATALCQDCGRQVAVDAEPPANGIDIAGEVVALDCEHSEVR